MSRQEGSLWSSLGKARLLADALAFGVFSVVVLRYLHHYEVWWARRGRAASIRFESSFFDHSIAPQLTWQRLSLATLCSTFCLWVVFELASRAFLMIFERVSRSMSGSR